MGSIFIFPHLSAIKVSSRSCVTKIVLGIAGEMMKNGPNQRGERLKCWLFESFRRCYVKNAQNYWIKSSYANLWFMKQIIELSTLNYSITFSLYSDHFFWPKLCMKNTINFVCHSRSSDATNYDEWTLSATFDWCKMVLVVGRRRTEKRYHASSQFCRQSRCQPVDKNQLREKPT